ncbi:hypothetical protein SAY86_031647 [Trapa natans]|uniref:ZF-HD dimerization-type domain-containing protein n=1 Tax=Trapa natans TaxID=22666 RepID=A0AAN7LUL1_TRANT|nr:hypothetical protein SAY86_031647 [Trapa natans]
MERERALNHSGQPNSNSHSQQRQQSQDHQALDSITIVSPQFPSTGSTQYRECLKNHAAKMGGNVTDGCGEFMPSGEEGSGADIFRCAACGCHRSFHRKEMPEDGNRYLDHIKVTNDSMFSPLSANPAVMMTFGGGGESSSEDPDLVFRSDGVDHALQLKAQKKRFRTKFTMMQKEEMAEFAEKIGWRIQKEDEQELVQFCAKIGVSRQVFKVWMHNNKQAMKKKHNKDQQEL